MLTQYHVGDYYRAFQLSDDYDKEKITAKLENGLLEVTVVKKEEAKPRENRNKGMKREVRYRTSLLF